MNVAVVIPWVDRGCPHRAQAYRFVRAYWEAWTRGHDDWVVTACHGPAPFSRAAAINAGVRMVGPEDEQEGLILPVADVILQSDPDSIVSPTAALEAVLQAREPGLVVAFERYRYLDADSTRKALLWPGAGTDTLAPGMVEWPSDLGQRLTVDEEGYGGVGNVVAFSRATWVAAGGYDERFGTWGGDDGAYAMACSTLAGPTRRVAGDMLHLWHPRLPESVPGHPEYERSMRIIREYQAADGDPRAMARLVGSR